MGQWQNVAGTRRLHRQPELQFRVVKVRRPPTFRDAFVHAYRTVMGDGQQTRETWAEYLRRKTDQPGWSVARLARESNIHRATIFKWMSGKGGTTVTSVQAIAAALGDVDGEAMRAASGSGIVEDELDPDLKVIMRRLADPAVSETEKTAIKTALRYLAELAEKSEAAEERPGRVIRRKRGAA